MCPGASLIHDAGDFPEVGRFTLQNGGCYVYIGPFRFQYSLEVNKNSFKVLSGRLMERLLTLMSGDLLG